MPREDTPAPQDGASHSPPNPILPCGHRKLDCPGGCNSSPHPPRVAEVLLEAGLPNDADLGDAVVRLVDSAGMTEVYIRNVWGEVMGPNKPYPKPGDPGAFSTLSVNRCALKWIWGKCMRVDWLWRQQQAKPGPEDLPEGVVIDE